MPKPTYASAGGGNPDDIPAKMREYSNAKLKIMATLRALVEA